MKETIRINENNNFVGRRESNILGHAHCAVNFRAVWVIDNNFANADDRDGDVTNSRLLRSFFRFLRVS